MYVNGIRWKSCGSLSSNIRYLSIEFIAGELDKAVKIMNEYFDEKLKQKQNELANQITNPITKSKKS